MADHKIIKRIRKVLALAEGTDNPQEAEIMMAKVYSMLTEHNLELVDVETASEDDPVDVDRKAYKHYVKDSWFRWTVIRLGQLYGVTVVYYKIGKNTTAMDAVGRESARITLQLMVPFVRKQIRAQAVALAADEGYSRAKAERYIANALNLRILRLAASEIRKSSVKTGGVALVPVDEIKQKLDSEFGDLTNVRQRSTTTTSKAVERAKEISLNRQTTGDKQAQIEKK